MSSSFFSGLDLTLFIVTIIVAMAMVAAALLRQIMVVMGQKKVVALQARNEKTQRRHDELRDQHEKLQAKLRQGDDEKRAIQAQTVELKRRAKQAVEDNFEFLHEIGEPGGDRKLWIGTMTLNSVLTIGTQVVNDSPLRSARNMVEIWADTQQAAQRLAKQTYPEDAGFMVVNIALAPAQRIPAAAQ
jgi:hypothetical protein